MNKKEATARIKINKLLETAGWRFFDEGNKKANIELEPGVKISKTELDAFGEDFEKTSKGYIDFLLLDEKGRPLIVLEAKSEDKNPLVGKEQARKYARGKDCRFIILSNGNAHFFWDLERGNPNAITAFPKPDSVTGYKKLSPNPNRIINENVDDDYIALTQMPNYATEAGWKNESEREEFKEKNKLRFLRPYQKKAIRKLQEAVKEGKDRFLFEMATGTGKTLTSAAIIKLFLRTENAQRVLFLVDRLELEDQAHKAFKKLLSNDFKSVIYKENRSDWRHAEIVVSTVQSLLFNNKYQELFSPTDFDLVISDEAHRSIGGNARAVFDYFIGYKLGLTATPKDYLRKIDERHHSQQDPREYERRILLDTYRTFGCENSQPTFRYSLLDGVKDKYLINPTIVDARSDITTQLLSEEGFVVEFKDDEGEDQTETYKHRQFEKKFFSEKTNQLFCKVFLENALRDPISKEIGKSIIFAVSQNHAAKLTQILNQMADVMYPGRYNSDFAVQVTSHIKDAQQFTINFANNNLLGSAHFIPSYKTSKARICVTVGMMTTGYDCPDLLNIGLLRPIFSPTDFIQIKGRGTRKHDFFEELFDQILKDSIQDHTKKSYKLIDFFANCEFFEEEFNYDEILELPPISSPDIDYPTGESDSKRTGVTYEHLGDDILKNLKVQHVGLEGMKIDRMFFKKFEDTVKEDPIIVEAVEHGQWDQVIDYVNKEIFFKPGTEYTLDKLRKAAEVDRRITIREILEKIFGFIPRFKSKDELLEEEFAKFIADYKPNEPETIPALKNYFKAYATSNTIREIIDSKHYTDLSTNPIFSSRDLKAVPRDYLTLIPEYIKDYVSLNQFTP